MDSNPSFFKHTTQTIPGPITTVGAGTNNGHGMSAGKSADATQMNAKSMITKEFIQQVPSAGTPAGKAGSGKEHKAMPTTEVSAHGMDAGK